MSRAIDGSARNPISRFVSVIPTCAADNCVDKLCNADSTPAAFLSPSLAARSTDGRSTVTNANSAATKAPHAATSASATRMSRTSIIGTPP
jgi:hypothetical protein